MLAHRLGYLYFDTGVMYRALTLLALEEGIDLDNAETLAHLAERMDIQVIPPDKDDGRQYTVLLASHDRTWDLRRPEVEQNVSRASRHHDVRAVMCNRQREIGKRGKVVMVGRDIGNIVMPDAALKVYLDTSLDERARRRAEQLQERGEAPLVDSIRRDVERRDALDRHVMHAAPDALVIQGDDLSPEQEIAFILDHLTRTGDM